MNIIEHSNQVLQAIRQKTNRVILFFSCGKDSLALLHLCSQQFDEVVLVFMYFVKDLEHINKYLVWAENTYSNIRVIQVPHWNLTYIMKSGMYCVAQPDIKLLKLIDVDEAMRIKTGINWTIYGFKKADGMNRLIMLRGYELEAINNGTRKAYPLSNWKDAEVLRYLEINQLPAPVNYGVKKRSNGVGFDQDVFLWLRANYPGDLEKILKQFPMAGRILFDYDRLNTVKI